MDRNWLLSYTSISLQTRIYDSFVYMAGNNLRLHFWFLNVYSEWTTDDKIKNLVDGNSCWLSSCCHKQVLVLPNLLPLSN